jgi:hypothetical protein
MDPALTDFGSRSFAFNTNAEVLVVARLFLQMHPRLTQALYAVTNAAWSVSSAASRYKQLNIIPRRLMSVRPEWK